MSRDPIYDAMKAHSKEKFDADRARFLADAEDCDDGGWTKHTRYHWSRYISGKRLNYWPSRKRFQLDNKKPRRGDVMAFIRMMEGGEA